MGAKRYLLYSLIFGGILNTSLHAAAYTMTASDTLAMGATTSFNSAGNWNNATAPASGNDYYTSGFVLRSPQTTGNFTFAGNSLTLNSGFLYYKGTGTSDIITVNNLIITGGKVTNATNTGAFTLAGNINITSTATFQITNVDYGFAVSSTIGGIGSLNITTLYTNLDYAVSSSYAVTLSGSNSYSGGTTIGTYAYAVANSSSAFGTGNVTVNGGKLTLQNASSIADSATLTLTSVATGGIYLNYSGMETLAALSFNGTTISTGSYSAADLNAYFSTDAFTGTGSIHVIPEPNFVILFLLGISLPLLCSIYNPSSSPTKTL